MLSYFELFRQRNFAFITIADAVSVLGDQVGWVALLWFAMVTTKNSGFMGILALVYGIPEVLLGTLAGTVLDCVSSKKVLVAANLLLGIVFMAIPLLFRLQVLSMTVLLAFVLLAGCLTPFTSIGWMIIFPKLVKEKYLGPANSIAETIWNGASMLGPLVSGVLIAAVGANLAILVDGISFWAAAFCVSLIQEPPNPGRTPEQIHLFASFFQETWDGIKTLYGLRSVWWITISALCINLAYGQLEVSLPLYAHNELAQNAVVLGSLWTTYFISSLVSSALSGLLKTKRIRSGMVMTFMATGWGLCFIPLLWFHSLWMTYVCISLAGFLFGGYPPLARTSVQRLMPKKFMGRVLGLRGSIIALGMPLGSYFSGMAGQWFSASSVIGFTGFLTTAVGLLIFSRRSFRAI